MNILKKCLTNYHLTFKVQQRFKTNPECKKLVAEQGQLFHYLVAQLLYLSKLTRQEIQTAIDFLCTRVTEPDTVDYKKLVNIMQYIRDLTKLTLNIELDDNPKWWVDRSYELHLQGVHVPRTTIYQDNKSTTLQAENGQISSSKEPDI